MWQWKFRGLLPLVTIALTFTANAGETLHYGNAVDDQTSARNAQQYAVAPSDDWQWRIARLEDELAALKQASLQSGPFQNAGFAPPVPNGSLPAEPLETCYGHDGICGKPAAKFPTFKVTGFFHLDAGFHTQDANSRATLATLADPSGDLEDSLGFRRARLAAAGKVSENTSYLMEFDFAQAQARFVDVWMQFADTPAGNIRIGRYRQPFGMDELTGVRELPFLERSTGFALVPFRQTGIMLFDTAADERVTWAISGYRYLSDNFGNVHSDTGGYGMATRVTMLPIDCGDEHLLHVGFDYSYNNPGRGEVQYASTNEFFGGQNPNLGPSGLSVLPIIGDPPLVNTGAVPTSHTNLFNVEAAAALGRFVVQSEARWAVLEQIDGTVDTFPAAYLHVRYVLTGEVIPYKRSGGVFGRVKPNSPVDLWCGGWGAWELAGRVSYIDLNGTGLPGPGRRLTNTVLGLNWYVNDFTKFQFNWIHSDLNDPTFDDSNVNTVAVRGQIDF